MAWAVEFVRNAPGRRVIWAPAHALGRCVSLRTWITEWAAKVLGSSAPQDASLLLSGAADVIIIADPASADSASLHWLTELLSCAEEVADLAATPPLPQLIVLCPARTGWDPEVIAFLGKLEALGAEQVRAPSSSADGGAFITDVASLLGRNDDLLAAMALMPVPLAFDDLRSLVESSPNSEISADELVQGPLFRVVGDLVVPTSAEVTQLLRERLNPESLPRGAGLLLPVVEARYPNLPDARVELSLRSGNPARAGKLARARFEEHYRDGRMDEALHVVEIARELELSMESGAFAADIDDAKLACLLAFTGRHEPAMAQIRRMARRRDLFDVQPYIQWLALGARHLILHAGFDAKTGDSLLRRAIRLAGDDLDRHIHLRLLRVNLLSSDVMQLEERASWLLVQINNGMLKQVSQATLAQYLEDTATRMWNKNHVRGAMRRLRKLIVMPLPDRQLARGLLLMARCRARVSDQDAAMRFANTALQHALRAADIELVKAAAAYLREFQSRKPRELPKLSQSSRRPRLPVVADIRGPAISDAPQVWDILQSRFGVSRWVRRRGARTSAFGASGVLQGSVSVYEEAEGGWRKLATGADSGARRALSLLRADGSDMVEFEAVGDLDQREDAIVRFLLADRESAEPSASEPPRRRNVLDDYFRRALDHGTGRNLHAKLERLFNKDLVLYFEEQGLGKDELAERLGISRATLYRMYARAGLNI